VRFVYKIFSGYDGFSPRRIPERLENGKFLWLWWKRYLDFVESGSECWVYFHGPHAFTPGVYIKGFVRTIDRKNGRVKLRVRESSTDEPLAEKEENDRLAEVVDVRYRQVFFWPQDWEQAPQCSVESCQKRLCETCPTWKGLRVIEADQYRSPERFFANTEPIPGYWVIPPRCYVYSRGGQLANHVYTSTHIFSNFKIGEKAYAYPLALGIFKALNERDMGEFDALIPIPLSPDKIKAKELHRTRILAQELGELMGVPVRECLELEKPISKRRLLSYGYTIAQFEQEYYSTLKISGRLTDLSSVLLVDDVITKGSTASKVISRLLEEKPDMQITVAAAGQMIVVSAVKDESGFLAPKN